MNCHVSNGEPREVIAIALSTALGREFGPQSVPVELAQRARRRLENRPTLRRKTVSIEQALLERSNYPLAGKEGVE
jgi:hypothetical protein